MDTDFLHSVSGVDGVGSALLQPWFSDPLTAMGLSPGQPFLPSAPLELRSFCPRSGSRCAAGLGTQVSRQPWLLPTLIASMSLLPKAGTCCAESGRSLGELSLFMLRPLQTNVLCQSREEIRAEIDLIQMQIILCSITFSFSRGINLFVPYGLPGIWDLLLTDGFLQPRSLHSPFSPFSPLPTEQCPYVGGDTALHPGTETAATLPLAPACSSVASADRALLPFSPLHGAGTSRQTLTQAVRIRAGWGGANYPVLTRVRPARALAVHTDVFPASCAG